MGPLNIGIVTATFPPYLGGAGNVALHNARCLADRGHRVTVYTARQPGAPHRERTGFDVRRLWTPLRVGNAPLLPGLGFLPRHDLVHLHLPFILGGEIIYLLARIRGQPYVVTYHNDLLAPGWKGVAFRLYDSLWSRRILAGARRVFVPSLDAAPASPKLGPVLARDPKRVEELPNGVDLTLFHPGVDGGALRAELSVGRGRPLLLFVGTMDAAHHPKGGVPVLLRVLAGMTARPALVLAGGGDLVARYQQQAAELGLGTDVRFVGPVPHSQLAEYYAAADLVVQPSQRFEPFGMVALEAMASGRAVVTSDLPGTRRVVGDAGGGILVPAGDEGALRATIEELASDPERGRRLGSAGRAAVERRFDWSRITGQLELAYRDVLEGG